MYWPAVMKGGIVSTVLTLTVEPYVPEENVLALRIVRVRAGLVPMPLEKVLDGISDAARRSEWRLEWRQSGGDPVALLSAPPPDNERDLAVKIETIRLGKGDIFVSGAPSGNNDKVGCVKRTLLSRCESMLGL